MAEGELRSAIERLLDRSCSYGLSPPYDNDIYRRVLRRDYEAVAQALLAKLDGDLAASPATGAAANGETRFCSFCQTPHAREGGSP